MLHLDIRLCLITFCIFLAENQNDGDVIVCCFSPIGGRLRREWFTLEGVSRYARPFINMFAPNDGASILRAEDGPSLDIE